MALLVIVAFCSCASQAGPKTPTPTALWDGPGEKTRPLPIVQTRALDIRDVRARRFDVELPAALSGSKLVANSGAIGYFGKGDADGAGRLHAVDLVHGVELWSVGGIIVERASASDALAFAPIDASRNGWREPGVLALDAHSGRLVANLHGVFGGNVLNGIYYADRRHVGTNAFAAIDARTAREFWQTRGTSGPGGPPMLIGSTLLQSFFEDGAISVNAMYGFDVVTGRQKWRAGWGPQPLGVGRGAVYLDKTWFPAQRENYFPLAVASVDPATGMTLHEYGYKPDSERNWPPEPGANPSAEGSSRVAGGYVYLRVNGAWYRYDADRAPADAHPVRLDGINDILDWLDANALLVSIDGSVGVARSLPDRLEWRRLARGSPRSAIIARYDGVRYLVAGDALLAIDSRGERAHRLGRIDCASVSDIVSWDAYVAARCPAALPAKTGRVIAFIDTAAPAPAVRPRPRAAPAPRYALRLSVLHAGAKPSDRRPWRNPSVVIPGGAGYVIIPGGTAKRAETVPVPLNEAATLVSSRIGVELGSTTDAVLDRHGTVWFKAGPNPELTSIDRSGAMRTVPLAEPSPTPVPGGGLRFNGVHPEIRLAIGPDGEAWFSGSDPIREIARVDASAQYTLGDDLGDVQALTGGNDGALWFLTATALGRIAPSGSISRVLLPAELKSTDDWKRRLIAGLADSVWIASGRRIAQLNARGVVRSFELPNISSEAGAIALGCDGTLYVVDRVGDQLARLGRDGVLEEFPVDAYSLDGIAASPDCRLWFTGRSDFGDLIVGTFAFAAIAERSRRPPSSRFP